MTRRRRVLPLLFWAGVAVCCRPAAVDARPPAQDPQVEEILSYDVALRIEADGWMEVTEEIRVRALGREIRRALYRDFSTTFPRDGEIGRVRPPFEVVRALRDGSPVPYVLLGGGNRAGRGGFRVRIGSPGAPFVAGEHTYTLTYRTARWLDIEDDRARLRWQVVGSGWSIPVRSASARVRLPGRVRERAVDLDGWVGEEGSAGAGVVTSFDGGGGSEGVVSFRAGRSLRPGEDMTIQLAFPARIVSALLPPREAPWVRLAWRPYTDAAVVVLAVLAFYLLVWAVDGRNPRGRPVVVRYEPPAGLSPAAVGYLDERGYDPRHMTAAIMSLARQGVLEVEEKDGRWTLRRIGPMPEDISPDERSVVEKLLPDDDALVILGISRRRVREARRALRKELRRRFQTRYFVTNGSWLVLGMVLSLIGFGGLAWQTRFVVRPSVWVLVGGLLVVSVLTGRLLTRGFRRWRIDLAEMSPSPTLLGASVFPLLAMLPLGVLFILARELYQAIPLHLLLAVLALAGINAVFHEIMERPTEAGREALDHVEGFKRFLTATEADRIERLSTKESEELFERFLPCAIALGMKNRWAAVFGDEMDPVVPGDG